MSFKYVRANEVRINDIKLENNDVDLVPHKLLDNSTFTLNSYIYSLIFHLSLYFVILGDPGRQ